ncbi:hypothetical protein [Streptomyces sp. NEAU-174]|uniref:hypothetical protein n=1 Tax=Streptomyces sp. NEAU-174 TaxID=3458254 RepID=UPI0040445EBE
MAAWAGVAGAAVIIAAMVLLLVTLDPSAPQLWVLVFAWPAVRTRLGFAVYALREPLSDINQALGHFSNGRIGIR